MNPVVDENGTDPMRQAALCIGSMTAFAMNAETEISFSVTVSAREDGSRVVNVLHPEGTYQFNIPPKVGESDTGRDPANGA